MNRFVPLVLVATGSLAWAQTQAQDPNGGWRRVGDPPPTASAPAPTANAPAGTAQNNPEPVARDQYGQPAQAPQAGQQGTADATPPPQPEDVVTAPVPPPQPPQTPQDAATQQRTTPPYGLPHEVTMKSGAYVTVRVNQPLSSDHNHQGDAFSATLMQPLVADGIVIAQRGQTVYGRVVEAEKAHVDKPSRLRLELTGVTLADGAQTPVTSQLLTRTGGSTPPGVQAGTVAGSTAVGAAIGGIAAWGTGAAIGAGAGAAAGLIGVLVTRHHPTVVYPETALTFQITSPVAVSLDRAPQAFRYVGPEDYQQAPMYANRPAGPGPGPRPAAPGYYYGGGYGYGYGYPPAYPYAYGYPYYPYYWGPSIGVYWGGGWGYRGWGRGRWR